jgi:hypothetical protein
VPCPFGRCRPRARRAIAEGGFGGREAQSPPGGFAARGESEGGGGPRRLNWAGALAFGRCWPRARCAIAKGEGAGAGMCLLCGAGRRVQLGTDMPAVGSRPAAALGTETQFQNRQGSILS